MKKTAALLIASLACSPAHALSIGDFLKALFSPPVKQESPSRSPNSAGSSGSVSDAKAEEKRLAELRRTRGLLKSISCTFHGSNNYGVDPNAIFEFPDPDQTVCDPLSSTPSESRTNGLSAKIYLPGPNMTIPVSTVMDYYNKGVALEQDVYFASINVPTRQFTKGFVTEGGSVLLDSNGNKLVENFALEYNSILKLSDSDKEGEYELASISDDGARVFFKEDDQWKELINNDGNHASRMGCAYRTIAMKRGTEVPIKVFYYQGSRYHVANVLMWKHHKDTKAYKRSVMDNFVCGKSGNNFFYNSSNEKPTAITKWLQSTGWQTISNANYKMPEHKPNPCTQEPFKIVGSPSVSAISSTGAKVIWSTNYPSSSQLRIANSFTGEVVYTVKDATLVTEHEVHIEGLVPGLAYDIIAISVDDKGTEVQSFIITYP
ncbi:PA14 domain-containing protein [Bdellovibrio sp. HCB290]|uniref:PA14 domain-containing protein n=1 Tax=Bdellovibrio sp. HCB290 TaxID=3394356 RepID=UPI0039B6BD8A